MEDREEKSPCVNSLDVENALVLLSDISIITFNVLGSSFFQYFGIII